MFYDTYNSKIHRDFVNQNTVIAAFPSAEIDILD